MVGSGTGAQMITEVINNSSGQFRVKAFINDDEDLWETKISGIPVLSRHSEDIKDLIKEYPYLFVGVISHKYRKESMVLFERAKEMGFKIINVCHPKGFISQGVEIGEGNYIGAFSYLAPYSKLGDNNYLSSYSCIEHHTRVGSHNSWGPCVSVSGNAIIGNSVSIGTGVKIVDHITIGDNVFLASDLLIAQNVSDNIRALHSSSKGGIKYVTRR